MFLRAQLLPFNLSETASLWREGREVLIYPGGPLPSSLKRGTMGIYTFADLSGGGVEETTQLGFTSPVQK